MNKIALFASGAGTNVLNLLERAKEFSSVEISCVIVDTETSPLPKILAKKLPIYRVLPNGELKGPERKLEHEDRIKRCLEEHQVQWVLLAGYMRLVGATLLERWRNRIINIHPSLLPAYPGLHAYERAFADGAEGGVTIHFVDEGLDSGPVILQKSFPREKEDTLEEFIERGKKLEWEMYPEILRKIHAGALT